MLVAAFQALQVVQRISGDLAKTNVECDDSDEMDHVRGCKRFLSEVTFTPPSTRPVCIFPRRKFSKFCGCSLKALRARLLFWCVSSDHGMLRVSCIRGGGGTIDCRQAWHLGFSSQICCDHALNDTCCSLFVQSMAADMSRMSCGKGFMLGTSPEMGGSGDDSPSGSPMATDRLCMATSPQVNSHPVAGLQNHPLLEMIWRLCARGRQLGACCIPALMWHLNTREHRQYTTIQRQTTVPLPWADLGASGISYHESLWIA